MATYKIIYNPYANTTYVEKNGVELKKNGTLRKGIENKRLQSWFEPDKSWEGFCKVLDNDNNDSKCHIEFIGREVDYVDLVDFFEDEYVSENGTEFTFSGNYASSDSEMLTKLLDLVKKFKTDQLFSSEQIEAIEESVKAIRENPFVISVIATMSSGKSTLLNALMHQELLPTGDDATTANIVEIFDNDREQITFEAFDENGNLIQDGDSANLETVTSLNTISDVRRVRIYGDIPGVNTEKMQLMLRDTPGPNNSSDDTHREITNSIIENGKDLSSVIYVMNATQLRVDSDKALLTDIAREMKEGGKQANDRFLFVINKVDLRLKKKEQTLEKLIEDTREYLLQFGIENPRIFPVTAGLACDVYKCRSGYEFDELTEWPDVEKNLKMFNANSDRIKFDLYASTSPSVKKQLEKDLAQAVEECDELEVALIHSGIKGLEYSIREYVEKYAYPIKVSDAVKEIIDTVDQEKMIGHFKNIIENDSAKYQQLQDDIKRIEEKKAERLAKKEEFEKEIDNYSLSKDVESRVRQSVKDAFISLTDEFISKIPSDKLKKNEAISLVSSLETQTHQAESKFDIEIKAILRHDVYERGDEILDSFKEYIEQIEEDLKIPEFDYKKMKDLKKFDFVGMKSVAQKVTSRDPIMKKETKTVPNPDRHWYTPWRSKTVQKTYDVQIGSIEYVSKSDLVIDAMSISANAEKNGQEMIAEANLMIEEFRKFFKERLKEFSEIIDSVIELLKATEEKSDNQSNEMSYHEDQLKKLEECIEDVNNITKFKGEVA